MNNDDFHKLKNDNCRKDKFQIWKQNFHSKRDDLIKLCIQNEEKANRISNVINDDEEKNNQLALQAKNDKIEKKIKYKSQGNILPDKVQININETKRLNEELRKNVDEISKMNAMYVLKNGGKYLDVKEKNNSQIQLELPTLDNKINEEIKSKKPQNFRYINDSYRQQLMRAFLNFNPIIHLNNLRNLLEKADPAIHEDINNLWQLIDRDLKEVLDPHYYAKKYDKIKQQNLIKSKTYTKDEFFKNAKKLVTDNIRSSDTIKTEKNETNSKLNSKNVTKPGHTLDKKKQQRKSSKFEALEIYKESVDEALSSLRQEKIVKYIEENQGNFDQNIVYEKQITKFFPEIKKIEDILHNLHCNKLNKNAKAEVEETKNIVNNQNEHLLKFIKDAGKDLMKGMINKEIKN